MEQTFNVKFAPVNLNNFVNRRFTNEVVKKRLSTSKGVTFSIKRFHRKRKSFINLICNPITTNTRAILGTVSNKLLI